MDLAETARGGDVPGALVVVLVVGALALGYVAYARNRLRTRRSLLGGAAAVCVAAGVVAIFLGGTSFAVAALFIAAILGAVALT